MVKKGKTRGKISVHRRGFGFVNDIFIPPPFLQGAVDGDLVEVTSKPGVKGKGPEGEVVKIVKRARNELAGTVVEQVGPKEFWAIAPILGTEDPVLVRAGKLTIGVGSRLVMRVDDWGDEADLPLCTAHQIIGHIDDPGCDIPATIREFELRTDFPKKISVPTKINPSDFKGRKDYRDLPTVTIDPASAKDFDDALSLSRDEKGDFHLVVHIADVSHYVPAGGPLDEEARKRSNSTYFPNLCIPMLPPQLADDLCSLKPGVARLAVSVAMHLTKHGKLQRYEIERSVIKSDQRFSYEEAAGVLSGKATSPYKKMLQDMVALCQALKKQRRTRGSVELAMPEVVLRIDEAGVPLDTEVVEYDITHQMVEEFMLKANEVIATHLSKKRKGLAYRVHEEPDPKALRDFAQLATAFGYSLPSEPTLADLQELFDKATGQPNGYYLAVGFIRSMKLATYSPDNIGHYGLSLEHYCHFTSPIRRYADLIVHRVVFGMEYEEEELQTIAKECSEHERTSARAEMSLMRLKKLRYLQQQLAGEPHRSWKGIVSRVKGIGISFEIVGLMLEGFIHVSNLGQDWFAFDQRTQALVGERSGERYVCGKEIEVAVRSLDLARGDAEWYLS